MNTRILIAAAVIALSGSISVLPTEASSAAEAYSLLRQAELDGRTIPIEDVTIVRDAFEIRFGNGRFHLLAPVDGRTLGAVFIGDGEYSLRPTTPAEQYAVAFRADEGQLETLNETFDRMVLFFTDGTIEELQGDSGPASGTPDPEAAQVLQKYMKWQREDYRTNVQLRMIENLFNNSGRAGDFFFALARGKRFERSLIEIDPLGVLDGEEVCLIGYEKNEDVAIWYSSHLESEIESGGDVNCGIKAAADARHYELDTRIYSGTDIEGTTTIHLSSRIPGLHVLAVGLLPSLRIEEIVRLDPDGGEPVTLGFAQEREDEDADLAVFLDAPLDEGQEATLRFRYDGKGVLVADGDGLFRVLARSNWYPHLGDFSDRATYDLTFRSPKGTMLVSVGEQVDSREDGDLSITRWKVEQPMVVAGFNYGKFREIEQQEKDSGTTIRVYTNPGTPDVIAELNAAATGFETDRLSIDDPESYSSGTGRRFSASTDKLAENVMADTTNSLRVYSKYFGELPFENLSLTQQSQFLFGQAWPSLIFIPYIAALEPLTRQALGLGAAETSNFVDEVVIHEVAHQWWGHQVGWASYRDQWLSEGFAEFSAALVLELTRGQKAADDFWMRWRMQLLSDPASKRQLAAIYAGPVTQGHRLESERSPLAYQKIVYGKGAFVLHMLRTMMRDPKSPDPDAKFFAMMKDFAQTYTGREATTEDFKAMVEKHIVPNLNATRDGKVDWFFNQWVYGVEVPTYRVEMDVEKAGGGQYRLIGTVSQENVSDDFMAMVPLYVDLGKGQYGMIGRAPFKGNQTHKIDTTIKLPSKPKNVLVNAHYEVLAWDPPKKKKKS